MPEALTRLRAIAVACGVVLAALSANATGAAAFVISASGPRVSFQLRGTHGYRPEVEVSPTFSYVEVSGHETRRAFGATTDYLLFRPQLVDGKRVRLSLGRFGRVQVRFRSLRERSRKTMPRFCHGGPTITRFGVFEGTIRFRGEHEYTSVDAQRVRGTVSTRPRQVCHPPHRHRHRQRRKHRHRRPPPLVTTFSATNPTASVSFEAVRNEGAPSSSLLFASAHEEVGRVVVSRNALAVAPARAFSFDPGLDTATIAPPGRPFSGSATFQRIDDFASRWEGPLTVSFPGDPNVPLTGRDFSWSLSSQRPSPHTFFGFGRRGVSRAADAAERILRGAAPTPSPWPRPGSPPPGSA